MMKRFAEDADHIFLACGATDFRKQIPGLVAAVTLQFQLDPYNGNYVFIFCNRKSVQDLAKELKISREKITVPAHKRTPRQSGIQKEMLAGLPIHVEEYTIPAEDTCHVCGAKLEIVGKRVVRTEVEFQPAKLIVNQIVQQIGKCTSCGKEGNPNEKSHFQKAAVPVSPLPHSICTPSLIAQIMYQNA